MSFFSSKKLKGSQASRKEFALSYYKPKLKQIDEWIFSSNETTNFTYDLTDASILYLCHTLSVVSGEPFNKVKEFVEEARNDKGLKEFAQNAIKLSAFKHEADETIHWGRRIGWYAMVRLIKPKVVVETGVDKGHGALILCAALLRNKSEGFEGRYFGTDINPNAGYLLTGKYKDTGDVLYGDSIETLNTFNQPIDLFINDSDHSADYEAREYEVIKNKLSPRGIILADNAHATDALACFALNNNRKFLFFKEEPKDHWYPGAGIGFSFV